MFTFSPKNFRFIYTLYLIYFASLYSVASISFFSSQPKSIGTSFLSDFFSTTHVLLIYYTIIIILHQNNVTILPLKKKRIADVFYQPSSQHPSFIRFLIFAPIKY